MHLRVPDPWIETPGYSHQLRLVGSARLAASGSRRRRDVRPAEALQRLRCLESRIGASAPRVLEGILSGGRGSGAGYRECELGLLFPIGFSWHEEDM